MGCVRWVPRRSGIPLPHSVPGLGFPRAPRGSAPGAPCGDAHKGRLQTQVGLPPHPHVHTRVPFRQEVAP